MATSNIPRGIQVVHWNTKEGQKTAYRVRITRKDFKGIRSKAFDSLDEAKEYLALSKTIQGKKLIYSVEQSEEERYRLDQEYRNDYSFEHFVKMYIRDYIDTKPRETELQKRNYASILAFYNTIVNTSILDRSLTYQDKVEMGIGNPEDPVYKFFGKFQIHKITPIDINNYIRTRKKLGLKPISIQREITHISNVFNKAKYFSEQDFIVELRNPTREYDRDLLKNNSLKREGILDDETLEKVFKALKDYSNQQLFEIVNLSLLTSMRRSEVVTLKKSQVKENYIQLIHTKSGKPRKVYLTAQAQEFIKTLATKNDEGNFFTYTIMGVDRVFREVMKRNNLFPLVKFHDFRKTAISRTLSRADDNSLLVANILGFSSVRRFHANHVSTRLMSTDTQVGALRTFGHDNPDVTNQHYFSPILDNVNKIKKLNQLKEKQQAGSISDEEKNELLQLLLELTS